MKLNALITLLLVSLSSIGQQVIFTAGEDKSTVITSIKSGESIEDPTFELFSHSPCSDDRQKELFEDFDGLKTVLTINGQEIQTEGFLALEHLYSFQADEDETYHIKPSIETEIPLEDILQAYGKFMKPTGNKLTITYIFKENTLASGSIDFSIPQFNEPAGDFCNLKSPYLTNEPAMITAISADFKISFADYQLVKVWLPYALSNDGEGTEETTGMVLFTNNGDYGTLKYTVDRVKGNLSVKGIDSFLIQNIHPDCVKAFLAN